MDLRTRVVYEFLTALWPGMGLLGGIPVAAEAKAEFVPAEKPRVIVLTDISHEPVLCSYRRIIVTVEGK